MVLACKDVVRSADVLWVLNTVADSLHNWHYKSLLVSQILYLRMLGFYLSRELYAIESAHLYIRSISTC